MKRTITLLLVFMLIIFTVMGCKKAGDETAGDSTVTDVPESVTTAPTSVPTIAPTVAPTSAPTVAPTSAPTVTAAGVLFKDGVYQVKSKTDAENYYSEATVTIEGGKIASADWSIYDAGRDNKLFDGEYYHAFEPDAYYVQQAKDDWTGLQNYIPKFLETQDVNMVDAVTGATWSYVEFEDVMNVALDQATEGIIPAYKDGIYDGQSATCVDKYYAKATVTVEGGKITAVEWNIYDSARSDALFDADYPSTLTDGWAAFQCNQNLDGMGGYADKLIETQNLYQVDAVSGATWSNIKFRQAVDSALGKAR